MDDNRVMVVDEQRPQRRVERVVEDMPADIEDIERPGVRRNQVAAGQFSAGLGKGIARRRDQAAAGDAEFTCQCGQSADRPQAGAAVLVALQTIAPGDGCRLRVFIPLRQSADIVFGQAADICGFSRGIRPGQRHEVFAAPVRAGG